MLVVPRRWKVVQKPDCSGGSVLLFVERESGNVWFPSRCRRARDPLLNLCEQSQPVGDSEHVFVYPVYRLSILVVALDRLLRVLGHTVVVGLTRVPSQLVGQVVASPVVLGFPAMVLVLLCLMSWDPLHMYGVRAPGCDDPLPEKPQVPSGQLIQRLGLLLPSLILRNPLTTSMAIVMGLGAYVAMMAAVSSIRVELLMAELIVPNLRVGSLLVSVNSSSMVWRGQ